MHKEGKLLLPEPEIEFYLVGEGAVRQGPGAPSSELGGDTGRSLRGEPGKGCSVSGVRGPSPGWGQWPRNSDVDRGPDPKGAFK